VESRSDAESLAADRVGAGGELRLATQVAALAHGRAHASLRQAIACDQATAQRLTEQRWFILCIAKYAGRRASRCSVELRVVQRAALQRPTVRPWSPVSLLAAQVRRATQSQGAASAGAPTGYGPFGAARRRPSDSFPDGRCLGAGRNLLIVHGSPRGWLHESRKSARFVS